MVNFEFWHHHIAISVPDLQASIEWYERMLGFKFEFQLRIEAIPAEVAFIANGPLRIEIFQPDHWQPLPADRRAPDTDDCTHGNKHGAFAVSDVLALHDELKRRGADIVWLKQMPGGGALFIRDNSGILLEFVQASAAPAGAAKL